MRRIHLNGLIAVGAILLMMQALIACGVFDSNKVTGVSSNVEEAELLDFIMGAPEITAWGAHYALGNSFFMLNVPVPGALKVEYRITTGATFAIFLETTEAVKLEIGLLTRDDPASGERVTDVLDSVCVSYEENELFASMPNNIDPDVHKAWTHYHRKTTDSESGRERAIDWWRTDAEFTFSGSTQTECVIQDGKVNASEVSGPFPKPSPDPVLPFLDVIVNVVGTGTSSDIDEFDVQEPGGGSKMGYMSDDGTGTLDFGDKTTGDADSVMVDQSWASGADPFRMYVPKGATIDGEYHAFVLNQWGGGSCPQDPLQVTIEVITHSASQIFSCSIPCNSPSSEDADILITFPAGAISPLVCH